MFFHASGVVVGVEGEGKEVTRMVFKAPICERVVQVHLRLYTY